MSDQALQGSDRPVAGGGPGGSNGGNLVAAVARPAPLDPDASFLPLVQEECRRHACTEDEGWHVGLAPAGLITWISVHNDRVSLPPQGWKLHVSAAVPCAEEVLRAALPVLLAERVTFKVADTIRMLGNLNSGLGSLSQVGKFITAYPVDDEQAVRLASALHQATRGMRGPAVPSDRQLSPGSLIHYRYGAFYMKGVQSQAGDVHLAIRTPDGEWVPDERTASYSAPEWVKDPFEAAGLTSSQAAPGLIVGRRYLIISTLFTSARGAVHAAVDITGMRRCVLKRARPNAMMGTDGTDAWDRLRNEARVLGLLSHDPRFPRVYELAEYDGDLFLAMEDVEGETLLDFVRSMAWQGRYASTGQVVTWGLELASMLATCHARGIAYRDLKPANVVVAPDGRLRLLDFDVSLELSAPEAMFSPGTTGYMSRQQQAGEPPRVVHDVYALGAVLYFAATGADLSVYPHFFEPLRRPVRLVNPSISPALSNVIARCLDPDPDARFSSMAEVDSALAALDGSELGNLAEEQTARDDIEEPGRARDHYRELARRLAYSLCRTAHRAKGGQGGEGVFWAYDNLGDAVVPRNVAVGSAGPVLALAELAAEMGDSDYRETAAEGARWLLTGPRPEGQPLPGLYAGEGGVGAALLRAGQVLGDDRLIAEAVAHGRWIARLPSTSPAVFNGTAGRLRFNLLLWDQTGSDEHLAAAIADGKVLLSSAENASPPGEEMLKWVIPPGFSFHSGRAYLGYGTGAAGIGDALLDLFEATGDERFLKGAQAAGRWVASLARPALNDESGLDWPQVESENLHGAFWGHGAAGIGIFFLHAAKIEVFSGAMELAEKAARTAARGTLWAGPTQAYGLCGPIEFLLDMYCERKDRGYLQDALGLAEVLETFAVERDGLLVWPSEDPLSFSPWYMAGYAGVATCLLRLSDPEHLPRLMSREAFSRRPGIGRSDG